MCQNDFNQPTVKSAPKLKRRRISKVLLSVALFAFFAAVTCYLGAQEATPEEIELARRYLSTGRFREPVRYSMRHSYRTNRNHQTDFHVVPDTAPSPASQVATQPSPVVDPTPVTVAQVKTAPIPEVTSHPTVEPQNRNLPTANEPWRQEIARVETRLLETKSDPTPSPTVPVTATPVVSALPNPAAPIVSEPPLTPPPVLAATPASSAPVATSVPVTSPTAPAVTAAIPVTEIVQPAVLPEPATEPTPAANRTLTLRPPATAGPNTAEPKAAPTKSIVMKAYQPAPRSGWVMPPEIEVRAREVLRSRLNELGLTGELLPAVNVTAPNTVPAPDINAAPVSEETLPVGKREKLRTLLRSYIADDISPWEYHAERARIIAEP